MKRKTLRIALPIICALAFALCAPVTAMADHLTGGDGWTVTFTKDGTVESSFKTGDIQDSVGNLQPGDDMTLHITLTNASSNEVAWYMYNTIVKSLEDGTAASGGAYTYELTYAPSQGAVQELYSSNRVGGDGASAGAPEGLHGVNSALKDYFFLETMPAGGKGTVTLLVKLDGESQGNGYQSTLADLQMRFAAEVVSGKTVVSTGDKTSFTLYYAIMLAAGAVFLILAFIGFMGHRKDKEAQ